MIYHVDTRYHGIDDLADWLLLRHMHGERLWIIDGRTKPPRSGDWRPSNVRKLGYRASKVTMSNVKSKLRFALSRGFRPVVFGDDAVHRAKLMDEAPCACRRRSVWVDLRESRGE